jgi:hypothetical protein
MRALRIFIALALLSAQHAALAHQIWHLADKGKLPAQNQLCSQHEALGTVAGALDCPLLPLHGETPSEFRFLSTELPAADLPGLAPSSRGPPTRP